MREGRKTKLVQELATLPESVPITDSLPAQLGEAIRQKLTEFRELLRDNVDDTRKILEEVLGDSFIQCRPIQEGKRKGYDCSFELSAGNVVNATMLSVASPRGFEPRLSP